MVRVMMRGTIIAGLVATLASCGGIGSGDSSPFRARQPLTAEQLAARDAAMAAPRGVDESIVTKEKSRT